MSYNFPAVSLLPESDDREQSALVRLLPGDRPIRVRHHLAGRRTEWRCSACGPQTQSPCPHVAAMINHSERTAL